MLQIAFEVLSFVSVISNCWLLLLSPQLQSFFQERRLSPTNALLLTVLVEVSFHGTGLSKAITHVSCCVSDSVLSAASSHLGEVHFADTDSRRTCLDPQKEGAHRVHVHAGLEAAGLLSDLHILNLWNLSLKLNNFCLSLFRSCHPKTPECISRVGFRFTLSCVELLQPEKKWRSEVPTSVFIASEESEVKPPAGSVHF